MKILSYQPHQKITYSGGLISLVLLPFLCLGWIMSNGLLHRPYAIDIVFADDKLHNTFLSHTKIDSPLHREFTPIYLTGDAKADEIKLSNANAFLKNLKLTNDTLSGLKFVFGPHSKYKNLVTTIDICRQQVYPFYFPHKNTIYALYKKPEPFIGRNEICCVCGGVYPAPQSEEDLKIELWNKRKAFLQDVINEFWAPTLVFVTMIIFTIIKLKRY